MKTDAKPDHFDRDPTISFCLAADAAFRIDMGTGKHSTTEQHRPDVNGVTGSGLGF